MREETLIIVGAALVVVAIGVAAFFSMRQSAAPAASPALANAQPSVTDVPFTKLVQGAVSNVMTRVNYRATSASQLQQLWKMINATSTPPVINFAAQEVIGVFAGQQPTPGYAIAVSNIEDAATRIVSITIARPEGACTTKHTTTAPYELVAVPATALPLTHEDTATTTGCP